MRTYHGQTGKLSLAHDEWLELNNKEFALYPSVRTLEGMSRQGQFIGLTQKTKHVVETIYLSGSITHRAIHQSGTGSKGNCTPEKILTGKVITPSVWEKSCIFFFLAGLRLVVIFMRWSKYIENAKFCAESNGGGAFYQKPPHPF